MVMEFLIWNLSFCQAVLERTELLMYPFSKFLFNEYSFRYFLGIYYVLNIVLK